MFFRLIDALKKAFSLLVFRQVQIELTIRVPFRCRCFSNSTIE